MIQVLLGHGKFETTALYTKVSTRTVHAVSGLLDQLMALMQAKGLSGIATKLPDLLSAVNIKAPAAPETTEPQAIIL